MMFRRLAAAFLLAAALHQPAFAEWNEAKSPHFIIYSEQRPNELRSFAEQLERFDQAVRKLRGMQDPPLSDAGKLTIYVLKTQPAVAAMAGARGSGIAGFYISQASGSVAFVHRERAIEDWEVGAQTVFFHEYTHHLMLGDSSAALPAWVSEGGAELFGTAQPKKDGSIVFGYVPRHRIYSLNLLRTMSTAEMVGATDKKIDGDEVSEIYARGWLLTHMLTFGKERPGQLNRYIAGIQKGIPAVDSARAAFGDLSKLGRDLDRYMEKPRLNGISMPASEFRAVPIAIRQLSEAEGAAMPVRMQLDRGVGKDDAEKVAGEARRLAAQYPADAAVLSAVALAEHEAEHPLQAVAAADRALALNPNSATALLAKARALSSLAEKEPAKADWKAIRALISRANRLDPDDAEPLMLFYRSFLDEGVAPTRNAVEGLLYAQALVPQDDELRMMAVQQLIGERKYSEAHRMLAPIAYNPHAGKRREVYLKIMDALAAKNGESAQSLLDQQQKEDEAEAEKARKKRG